MGFVAKKPLRDPAGADDGLGRRTVVRRTAGQQEGNKTSLGISDSMDFRIPPATRASDRLILLPPFRRPPNDAP